MRTMHVFRLAKPERNRYANVGMTGTHHFPTIAVLIETTLFVVTDPASILILILCIYMYTVTSMMINHTVNGHLERTGRTTTSLLLVFNFLC